MRYRFALTVALLALTACEATDTLAPYEESMDFELEVVDAPNSPSSGRVVMGGTDTLRFKVPDNLLGGDVLPVYEQVPAPFQMSLFEDMLYLTYPRAVPAEDDGSTVGTAGGGGGGTIGMYDEDTESVRMAPAPIHIPVFAQLGALRGEGEVRGVVGLSTVALRPSGYGDAAGICLPTRATVDGVLIVHRVTVLADARSIPQDGLPGGSYRVPVEPTWSVGDSSVVHFENTWGEGGAEFARIAAHAEGETVLRVGVRTAGTRVDTIPVRVSSTCPA